MLYSNSHQSNVDGGRNRVSNARNMTCDQGSPITCSITLDLEEGDYRLFARMRQDGEPDGTRLDIHDARRWLALGEDRSCRFVLEALQSQARPIGGIDRLERRWGLRFTHRAALHWEEPAPS